MTRSSGQLVTTITRDVECDGTVVRTFTPEIGEPFTRSWPCTYADREDITVDPETMWAGWECIVCKKQHEIPWDEIVGGDAG